MNIYDYSFTSQNGEVQSLEQFEENVVLIVNTASKCGFSPQFSELQSLYEKYKDQGLQIIGFPCNQFLQQDPGDDKEIADFCTLQYNVTFPMSTKVKVNGKDANDLFTYLKEQARGVAGSKSIKWNFTKFLIDKRGKVLKRYAPSIKPLEIEKDIIDLL